MECVKCFDAVTMVTDEATSQFGSLVKEDSDKKLKLKDCCDMIDAIAKQYDGISYETKVDDETMDITVSLVCNEFETTSSGEFCRILPNAKNVLFRARESDQIQIGFVFDGIWVRVV